jgi:hypothetical protein
VNLLIDYVLMYSSFRNSSSAMSSVSNAASLPTLVNVHGTRPVGEVLVDGVFVVIVPAGCGDINGSSLNSVGRLCSAPT